MKSLVRNHKCVVSILLALLIVFGAYSTGYGQADDPPVLNVGEPRTVRLFYFLPNDRPYRKEVVDAMKTGIVELQTFFADQMETHGHRRKTFQFETDDQGNPIVHRVDGNYPASGYDKGYTEGEITRAFDNSKNVIIVVMDMSWSSIDGQGAGGKSGGFVPAAVRRIGMAEANSVNPSQAVSISIPSPLAISPLHAKC